MWMSTLPGPTATKMPKTGACCSGEIHSWVVGQFADFVSLEMQAWRTHSCVPCSHSCEHKAEQGGTPSQGVHTIVNAARVGACATLACANGPTTQKYVRYARGANTRSKVLAPTPTRSLAG